MAIPDLLWACPECGEDRGLSPESRHYRCRRCGTVYRRGEGAAIEAQHPDGTRTVRQPAEWMRLVPTPESIVSQHVNDAELIRSAKVDARWVTGTDSVHGEDGFLNYIEVWGQETSGTLRLWPERLVFAADGDDPVAWALASLRAVQASSSSLQVNGQEAPLVSFHFQDDSILLWEELLHAALRDLYARTGKGEIVEFQPRIVTA